MQEAQWLMLGHPLSSQDLCSHRSLCLEHALCLPLLDQQLPFLYLPQGTPPQGALLTTRSEVSFFCSHSPAAVAFTTPCRNQHLACLTLRTVKTRP